MKKDMKICKLNKCSKISGMPILICPVCPSDKMYLLGEKMVKDMCKNCQYKHRVIE